MCQRAADLTRYLKFELLGCWRLPVTARNAATAAARVIVTHAHLIRAKTHVAGIKCLLKNIGAVM